MTDHESLSVEAPLRVLSAGGESQHERGLAKHDVGGEGEGEVTDTTVTHPALPPPGSPTPPLPAVVLLWTVLGAHCVRVHRLKWKRVETLHNRNPSHSLILYTAYIDLLYIEDPCMICMLLLL